MNGREGSQAETLSLAVRKNSDAITFLQQGSLLILAVLLSSYGTPKSLYSKQPFRFAMTFQLDVLITFPVTFCDLIGAAIYLQRGQVRAEGVTIFTHVEVRKL